MTSILRALPSWAILLLAAVFASGCVHWVPVSDPHEVVSASRVRITSPDEQPVVMSHPMVAEVREIVLARRDALVDIERTDVGGTVAVIVGSVLLAAGVGLLVIALVAEAAVGGMK